jgi:hypothetical protein
VFLLAPRLKTGQYYSTVFPANLKGFPPRSRQSFRSAAFAVWRELLGVRRLALNLTRIFIAVACVHR